jgi:hypothetical protein
MKKILLFLLFLPFVLFGQNSIVVDDGEPSWRTISYFTDFIGNTNIPFTVSQTGTGAGIANGVSEPTKGAIGIVSLSKGTTTTGRVAYTLSDGGAMYAGNGELMFECRMQVVTALADATDAYTVRLGFGRNSTGEFTHGIYFEYNYAVSPNWYFGRAANASRTEADTSVPVEITAFHVFKIIVNSTGTEVKYYIDEALVGTFSNVTDLTSDVWTFGPFVGINSSAGTVARLIQLDWIKYKWNMVNQYIQPSI